MSKTLNRHALNKSHMSKNVDTDVFNRPRLLLKSRSKVHLKPGTLAVLVQCIAFMSVLVFSWGIHFVAAVYYEADWTFSLLTLVQIQALLAAIFSYLAGMSSWWRWIHLGFPIAIWSMFSWHVPNEYYLAGFIISLSLFWTTFRSQVPFFPSRPAVWRQVSKLMPMGKSVRLIDIGSGLGDMPMYIAKVRQECHIEGIEIAPLPWLISFLRKKILRSSAIFRLGDYRALDFANYDVIFAYLSPAAMLALWGKASREMKSGSLLISLEFEIPGVVPSMRIAGNKNSPMIYVWRMP